MYKTLKKILVAILIIGIILFLFFRVFRVQDKILTLIYPTDYSEYVEKYAKEFHIDKLFIFSMIKAESNFKPDIVSSSGAIGLMQLMETTAEETASKLEISYQGEKSLYDPETNIQLGTKYISDLLEEYNGNYLLALTAYNAGKGNVAKWIENGTIQADGSDIENIPFRETNNYVRKILRDYKMYQKIYET